MGVCEAVRQAAIDGDAGWLVAWRGSEEFDVSLLKCCDRGTGRSPLHLSAQHATSETVIRTLLALGCPLDAPDRSTEATPLHLAVASGNAVTTQALLRAGADPTLSDKAGCTVTDLASDNAAILTLLLKHILAGEPPPPPPPKEREAAATPGSTPHHTHAASPLGQPPPPPTPPALPSLGALEQQNRALLADLSALREAMQSQREDTDELREQIRQIAPQQQGEEAVAQNETSEELRSLVDGLGRYVLDLKAQAEGQHARQDQRHLEEIEAVKRDNQEIRQTLEAISRYIVDGHSPAPAQLAHTHPTPRLPVVERDELEQELNKLKAERGRVEEGLAVPFVPPAQAASPASSSSSSSSCSASPASHTATAASPVPPVMPSLDVRAPHVNLAPSHHNRTSRVSSTRTEATGPGTATGSALDSHRRVGCENPLPGMHAQATPNPHRRVDCAVPRGPSEPCGGGSNVGCIGSDVCTERSSPMWHGSASPLASPDTGGAGRKDGVLEEGPGVWTLEARIAARQAEIDALQASDGDGDPTALLAQREQERRQHNCDLMKEAMTMAEEASTRDLAEHVKRCESRERRHETLKSMRQEKETKISGLRAASVLQSDEGEREEVKRAFEKARLEQKYPDLHLAGTVDKKKALLMDGMAREIEEAELRERLAMNPPHPPRRAPSSSGATPSKASASPGSQLAGTPTQPPLLGSVSGCSSGSPSAGESGGGDCSERSCPGLMSANNRKVFLTRKEKMAIVGVELPSIPHTNRPSVQQVSG